MKFPRLYARRRELESLRKVAMKQNAYLRLFIALTAVVVIAGCSRDPNVRKQKYLESGERYFEKQDYRAASIQFRNAVQIDPKYADAHYQLALSDLQLQDWRSAYGELTRTLDLAPENFKAQISMGNLLLSPIELASGQ